MHSDGVRAELEEILCLPIWSLLDTPNTFALPCVCILFAIFMTELSVQRRIRKENV